MVSIGIYEFVSWAGWVVAFIISIGMVRIWLNSLEVKALASTLEQHADVLDDGLAANQRLLLAQVRINEDLIKERDEAWAMHRAGMLQSGNGQRMLAGEIRRLKLIIAEWAKSGRAPTEVKLPETIEKALEELNV
jgi:hypothetical protein